MASEIGWRKMMPAHEPQYRAGSGRYFSGQVNFVDAGLVLDEAVADDQPSGWPVDAAELGIDKFGAFGDSV